MTDVAKTSNAKSFQRRVLDWMMETFSMEVTRDTTERNHRYLEESLELVQAMGCTQSEAHQLVDYVYGRPVGEPQQEVGGALVTLSALCSAADFDMTECGDRELARCWQNIERIRAKQAGKPKHSPLPAHAHETRAWRSLKDEPIPAEAFAFKLGDWWIELPPHPSGIAGPPAQKAVDQPSPVDDAEFGTAEWRAANPESEGA